MEFFQNILVTPKIYLGITFLLIAIRILFIIAKMCYNGKPIKHKVFFIAWFVLEDQGYKLVHFDEKTVVLEKMEFGKKRLFISREILNVHALRQGDIVKIVIRKDAENNEENFEPLFLVKKD